MLIIIHYPCYLVVNVERTVGVKLWNPPSSNSNEIWVYWSLTLVS